MTEQEAHTEFSQLVRKVNNLELELTIEEGQVANTIDFRVRLRGNKRIKQIKSELKELRSAKTAAQKRYTTLKNAREAAEEAQAA